MNCLLSVLNKVWAEEVLEAWRTRQPTADLQPTEEGRVTVEEKQVLHGPLCDPKSLCTHTSCRASWSDLQQYTLCYGYYSCSRIHPVGKNYTANPLFSHRAALSLGDFPSKPWTCLSFQNQKALIESLQNWPLSIHNNQDPERESD